MPPPMSLYQAPACLGSSPAAAHRRFSLASVPLLSPRATQGALDAHTACIAGSTGLPAIAAGSAEEPTMMKSFQATRRRTAP